MSYLRIFMLIPFVVLMSLIITSCSSDDKEEHFLFRPSHKDKNLVSMTYISYWPDSTIDYQIEYSYYYDVYERLSKVDKKYSDSEDVSTYTYTYEWIGNVVTESNSTYILNNEGLIASFDGGSLRYNSNNRPIYYKPAYGDSELNIVWNKNRVNYVIEEGDTLSFLYSNTTAKGCNILLLSMIHYDLDSDISIVHPELLGMDFESPLLLQVKHDRHDEITHYTYEISDDGYIEFIKKESEEILSGKRYVFLRRTVTYKWE